MWSLIFALLAFVHCLVSAAGNLVQVEALAEIPRGWEYLRPGAPTDAVNLQISLTQQNLDSFYDHLLQISTPSSPRYGKHYEGDEIHNMLSPTDESSNSILEWLRSSNIASILEEGHYIRFHTDVATANELLSCSFSWFYNKEANMTILRTMDYFIPEELRAHVNYIQPTTMFARIRLSRKARDLSRRNKKRSDAAASKEKPPFVTDLSCNHTVTPECVFNIYNIHYKGNRHNGNTLAIASFLDIYTQYADLLEFQKIHAPYMLGENYTVVEFEGGLNVQGSTGETDEGNLDMQYSMGIGFPTPSIEFSTGGLGLLIPDGDSPTQADDFNEPYVPFLQDLLKLPNDKIPNSLSISYNDDEMTIPVSYATQACNLFAQLGARGKTVMVVSGDIGPGHWCLSNDGKNRTTFVPQFPASCPWVTAVGGTTQIDPEVAAYISGGGFSNIFPRPAYQDTAVLPYLEKVKNQNKGLYNPSGRGIPDVALQSLSVAIVDKGVDSPTHGTSCGGPMFNGMIALLNSARIDSGLSTLGFLNPWLYQNPQVFTDITIGRSQGCNGQSKFMEGPDGSPVIPNDGWMATEGWDAATGLGSPNFGKMLHLSTPLVKNEGGVVLVQNAKLTY